MINLVLSAVWLALVERRYLFVGQIAVWIVGQNFEPVVYLDLLV